MDERLKVAVALWRRRQWLFGAYMLVAVARIPARTGFRLAHPACDTRLTLSNAALSLTKVPHIVLFGVFFLLTVIQFPRIDRRALSFSLLATFALGLLIEFEEGATRTGNCRLTDVLPDLAGAAVAAAFVIMAIAARRTLARGRTPDGSPLSRPRSSPPA